MFRRSPRALALWGAALVVAVVTATVVATDLAAIHRRASSLGPEVRVLVATRDLPTGAELSAADVATRRVHRSQLPGGTVVDGEAAQGRVVTVPVLRGGYVTEGNLAPPRRTGLDGVLPAGSRAIRIDVASALVPRVGAAVDVLASYSGASASTGESTGDTVVVAAGALVLGTDRAGSRGTGRSGVGVTVLVDTDEARDLADAQANGVLTIALVPPEEATRWTRGPGR